MNIIKKLGFGVHYCVVCDKPLTEKGTINYALKICSGECLTKLDKKMAKGTYKYWKGNNGWGDRI